MAGRADALAEGGLQLEFPVIANSPHAAAPDRPTATRTPLDAVFRRLASDPHRPAPAPSVSGAQATASAPISPPSPEPEPTSPAAEPQPLAATSAATAEAEPNREPVAQVAAVPPPVVTPPPPSPAEAMPVTPPPAEAMPVPTPPPPAEATPAPPPPRDRDGAMPLAEAAVIQSRRSVGDGSTTAAAVPAWLVRPVLAIPIPDSPFGRGSGAPAATAAKAGATEPETVGFIDPEPEPAAAPEDAEAASPESAVAEPEQPPEPVHSLPEQAASSATLAQSLRRGIGEAAESGGPNGDEATSQRLPRSPGEPRPTGRQLRSERPLGAPQAPRPSSAAPLPAAVAGLPATDVPPLVEPQRGLVDTTEAAPPRPAGAPMRNRRLYRRVGLDAAFEINGTSAKLVDLSMGGFAAASVAGVEANGVVPVTVRVSIDGVDIATRMRARIVYAEPLRVGGRFVDLTASQTAFLRYVVSWRGQSVGAIGTTTLLEAITRPPQRHPAEVRAIEPPGRARSRWWRWFGWLRARGAPEG